MPRKPKSARPTESAPMTAAAAPTANPVFVVALEYARRSFKCVLVDWPASDGHETKQWIVTEAGRAVWSFPAGAGDTRETVQAQVERWWDSQNA